MSDQTIHSYFKIFLNLALWCAYGVLERCLATQYTNDSAGYLVEPPDFAGTNASGWYLDQEITNRSYFGFSGIPIMGQNMGQMGYLWVKYGS